MGDSLVTEKGKDQIKQVGDKLRKDNFVSEKGIQLVAHSPLIRVRETSVGLLGCVTSTKEEEGCKAPTVQRVIELPSLEERLPSEWLPGRSDYFSKRIEMFEQWLCEQPEDIIAIVGHSQFFKKMLGLSYKFHNCDVYVVQFYPNQDQHWGSLTKLYSYDDSTDTETDLVV